MPILSALGPQDLDTRGAQGGLVIYVTETGSQEELDQVAKSHLQDWLSARRNLFPVQVAPVLVRLDKFNTRILSENAGSTIKAIGTGSKIPRTTTELVAAIAEALVPDLPGTGGDILRKSLQEVFLYTTGVDGDQSPRSFDKNLKAILGLLGSKAFIRLFLQFHLFNVIWIELQDSLQAAAQSVRIVQNQMEGLQRMCVRAVNGSMGDLKKGPEFNQEAAETLVSSLESAVANLADCRKPGKSQLSLAAAASGSAPAARRRPRRPPRRL